MDGTWVDAVRRIDDRIAHLSAELHKLNLARNAAVPIGRLPGEVLMTIFEAHEPEHGDPGSRRWTTSRLFPILHTCSHWRRLAFACRSLWYVMAPADWKKDLVEWFLLHGRNAPLWLSCFARYPARPWLPKGVLENVGRIQALTVLHEFTFAPLLEAISESASPSLRSLEIIGDTKNPTQHYEGLLGACKHSLQHLYIAKSNLLLSVLPHFVHLKTLALENVSIRSNTPHGLLSIIYERCPTLHRLVLRPQNLSLPEPHEETLERISFPHLRELEVDTENLSLHQFLRIMLLHPQCQISLATLFKSNDEPLSIATVPYPQHSALLDALQSMPLCDGFACQTVYLTFTGREASLAVYDILHHPLGAYNRGLVKCAGSTSFLSQPPPCVDVALRWSSRWGQSEYLIWRRISEVVCSIAPAAAASLSLSIFRLESAFWEAEILTACLTKFDAVSSLCLTHAKMKDVHTLAQVLLRDEGAPVVMARLSSLEMRFHLPRQTDFRGYAEDAVMRRIIEGRAARGVPLQRFILRDAMHMSETWVDMLAQGA